MKVLRERRHARTAVGAVSVVALVLGLLTSRASAASTGQSDAATSKDWTVTVWVARTSTRAGTTIPATVTVDNRTSRRISFSGCPGTIYELILGNAKVPNSPVIATVLCLGKMTPGIHVFHTKVQSTYQVCVVRGTPPCGNPPKPSPLPTGTYHTQIVLPDAKPSLPTPRPLTITLTT